MREVVRFSKIAIFMNLKLTMEVNNVIFIYMDMEKLMIMMNLMIVGKLLDKSGPILILFVLNQMSFILHLKVKML